jgi:hypothetical protein
VLSPIAKARLVRALTLARSARRDSNGVHRAADAYLKPMTRAVQAALEAGRKALGTPPSADRATAAVRKSLETTMPVLLAGCMATSGESTVRALPKARTAEQMRALADYTFDKGNKRAAAWAREHAAELIDGISDTTRDAIRDAIARSAEVDLSLEDARQQIEDAVGDEDRATLIARTETMTAANEGQREGWAQAVDGGFLSENSRVAWIATSDACPECEDLDGSERSLDGEYDDPDAGDGPPLHPNCRCTEGIVS